MTKPIAVIGYDLETTGQDQKTAKPLQVAAILERPGLEPMVVMNCLANPGVPIDKGASEVHGYYQKDIATMPPAEVILYYLGMYIERLEETHDIIIAGQNQVSYDNAISIHSGWPEVVGYPQIDTLTLARRLYPRLQNHKLDTLYAMATGKELIGGHDASVDVMAVIEVMKFMLPEFDNDYRKMAEACGTPQAWDVFPISKNHKGKPTKNVPISFFKWMINNTEIMEDCADFRETVKVHFTFLYEAYTGKSI